VRYVLINGAPTELDQRPTWVYNPNKSPHCNQQWGLIGIYWKDGQLALP
jgi:hypothetical protein